ncbi:CatB-related O-acetyltransferase [Mucilaginibacter pedocola]|uniref:Chloramphenicol acetyltransferase n=1 Tax=Mucilaginibacter pedocola TaxID=1792845 RepID=A0A1S9P819_9SPHI|nr:CatB-related O-acetyltransferase [Mucilaginibacter pedocola]OOQ57096.1 hypothetical protein BC343_16340 [Mucilaginibacter pedocola]
MNELLYKLYFLLPRKFRKSITKLILKREGGQMYSPTIRRIYKKQYRITIGYGTYGGCFNAANVPADVSFGNYCSIAQTIKIFRANHPKGTFTSHPLLYNPAAGHVKTYLLPKPPLEVGHDVWIGEGTTILPNVSTIGNGAMIGAASVVTKNVEPYTIVAGNPAKKIGVRFDAETIAELEKTQWWLLSKTALIEKIDELNKITKGSIPTK